MSLRAVDPSFGELRPLIALVRERSGIILLPEERDLIVRHLRARLDDVGKTSLTDYLDLLEADRGGAELNRLLDSIAWVRRQSVPDDSGFEFLCGAVAELARRKERRFIDGWHVAAASGEEVYLLGMHLLEAVPDAWRGRLRLLASDNAARGLATAREGSYGPDRLAAMPERLVRRYFVREEGRNAARATSELRQLVDFQHLNLRDVVDLAKRFDFIVCRNVLIYLDPEMQQNVLSILERHLLPEGYLILSTAESLNGLRHELLWRASSIFQKRA